MQKPEHPPPQAPDQLVVLIAEDEIAVLKMARSALEREGCFVLTAENGELALSLSRQYPGQIHLLLTDVIMPKMTGLELCDRISSERPGIRVVLMSGHSFAENVNPKFPFLQKPFTARELSNTIKALIPVRARTAENAE